MRGFTLLGRQGPRSPWLSILPPPRQAMVIAGSGRGGTTWVGALFAARPHTLTLFEPWDRRHVPGFPSPFVRTYIPPDATAHPCDSAFADALCGRSQTDWTLAHNTARLATRVVVKEIRANLYLGYLARRFQPRLLWLIRHPCAVVHSRLRLGWDTHLDDFLLQPALMRDHLDPFADRLRAATSPLERHTLTWIVENWVPWRDLRPEQAAVAHYEDVVEDPLHHHARIAARWGVRLPPPADPRRPSGTAHQSPATASADYLGGWRTELAPRDIDRILSLVHAFGIPWYDHQPGPTAQRAATDGVLIPPTPSSPVRHA
jgi:hypothetical protein